jgi:hypothetical protein
MLEEIYCHGPEADLADPPRIVSPDSRRHARAIMDLIG